MNVPLPAVDQKTLRQALRAPARAFPLAAALSVVLTLQCAPLFADEADDAARANRIGAPPATILWMSGGVGDEAREEMRAAAANYNVHLVFADRHGAYLANIPFIVTSQRSGHEVHCGVSEGPLLYMNLPRGAYKISAMIDGTWQSRRIQAGVPGRSVRVSFIARGE